MTGWRWVDEAVVLAIHDAQIAEHGGAAGVRGFGGVQSALGRPRNLVGYGTPDAADRAAAYAFGVARNHGFVDGNQRTAFVVALVCLLDHGFDIGADDAEAVATMSAVAAGEMDETVPAAWLRRSLRPASR